MTQITLGLIKPNATKLKLEDSILKDIETSDYDLKIEKHKRFRLTQEQASEFYGEHKSKPWFGELIDFMTSGDVIAFVLSGSNAVSDYRTLMGNTDPSLADEGTLREKYATLKEENSVHGSDSVESGKREISLIFG